MKTHTRHTTLATRIILAAFLACPVFGEETASSPIDALARAHDRVWFTGGLFYPQVDSSARLDGDSIDIGTEIDLENDLGLDESMGLLSLQGGFYVTQRFRVALEYFELNRSSAFELNREIIWGDEVFEAGATVGTRFDVAFTRLAVGYDFYQEDTYTFGTTIGAHFLDASAGIEALVSITGSTPDNEIDSDASTSGLLPVPNVGFYGNYLLGNRWRLEARLDWFGIKVGEWDGTLLSTELNARYFFTRAFSIGAGLQYFLLEVNYDNSDWQGELSYEYFGPKLELGLHF